MAITFLKELRDAAKACSNIDYRALIKQSADSLQWAIAVFARDPTKQNMIDLNGAWANAAKILKEIPPEGDPAPLAGAPEAAKLALAA